jgi:limonene-1,2-epoxide hydrolase
MAHLPGHCHRLHIEGRAAVAELYRPYGTMIILDRCFDLAVHHDATKGIVVLTLREGEVAHWRDYLDLVAVFDALGWAPR